MTMIPQATKDLWLPLLRADTMKQCVSHLYDGWGYCCLGVYAKACGATFLPEVESTTDEDGNVIETESGEYAAVVPDGAYVTNVNDSELLKQTWADKHGITKEIQTLLSAMNDGMELHLANEEPLAKVARKHAVTSEEKDRYDGEAQDAGCAPGYVPGTVFGFDKMSFAAIAKVIEEDL